MPDPTDQKAVEKKSDAQKKVGVPNNEAIRNLIAQLMAQKTEGSQVKPVNEHKPIDEYKFWKTQPVSKFEKEAAVKQGPLQVKQVSDVPTEPQALPTGFKWCTVDITNEQELAELYDLLYWNYVEDDDEQFRFKYSASFLKWALTPPGWNPEFAVGVRSDTGNPNEAGKLLAFISGIPADLTVRGEEIKTVEINFLCVHKKLRSKRMAPVLIKEVTRRVNLTNVWQALFTAGTLIPTPVATARYYHRVINWSKLYDVGFASMPPGSTRALEVARSAIPGKVDLPGFRALEEKDIAQVGKLLASYLAKFDLHQTFSEVELRHWFLKSEGDRESPVMSYVVESPDGEITEFVSAYGLETSVLGNAQHNSISIAYSFYYATTAEAGKELESRLTKLFRALLVQVKSCGYDVLNALTVMDNPLILESLNFKSGDGFLHYNLFNWATPAISGGIDEKQNVSSPGGIGVILL